MKLRNMKTGEIIDSKELLTDEYLIDLYNKDFNYFNSKINKILEEWEDYKEPKEYWYIDSYEGTVIEKTEEFFNLADKERKEIGNYFETREEAEKAVEKLKAVKRLKDYNVKFNLDFVKNKIDFTYSINNPLLDVLDGEEQIFNNMKVVFGDEK